MQLFTLGVTLSLVTLGIAEAATPAKVPVTTPIRTIIPFDADWRFLKADATGAEQTTFNDVSWRILSVPHDWSIEGPFDEQNPTRGAGAFLPAGIGWYRKQFTVPSTYAKQRVFIDFDGVMANSDVWINGTHLGKRPNGYVGFRYDMTKALNFGKPNVLAVRVDNAAQPASRWYAGAGITRHVRLLVTNPVHVAQSSTFVTTPKIELNQATVHVASTIINDSETPQTVTIQTTILGPDGSRVVQSTQTPSQVITAGKSSDFQQEITIANPKLWDVDHPTLYRAQVQVLANKTAVDDDTVPFGIRDAHFEAATGFWLNGKNIKLKGVCLHSDAGGLGVAVPASVWERRLAALKTVGCNAIRTSHNPVAPEFLDLCDKMGFLVMDEFFDTWINAKNPYDYHVAFKEWGLIDLRDTVMRDRNHPSIIIYSAGNEIRDTTNAEVAKQTLTSLITAYHQYDPTRPVTQALFRPNASHDYDNGLADLLDVVGQNYRESEIIAAHEAKPTRKIIGTENGHDRRMWLPMRDNPAYSGQFLWTGIDYLGESKTWPTVGAGSGLFDRTGRPRPMAFQRTSWWSDTPMVSIGRRVGASSATPSDPGFTPLTRRADVAADWTPSNTTGHDETVEVYSNCEQVDLVLNGKSLGAQPRPKDDGPRVWHVAFEPGTLKAVASNNGKTVATDELRTAGKSAKITLTPDQTTLSQNWDDAVTVRATVTDANGIAIPDASDLVTFKLTGPGAIAAVDNGDIRSHELFQTNERHAYDGQCVAILKATASSGPITLTASAPGIASSTVTIAVK